MVSLTTQVPVNSSREEELLEAGACRAPPELRSSQEAPVSGEKQVEKTGRLVPFRQSRAQSPLGLEAVRRPGSHPGSTRRVRAVATAHSASL